MTKFEKAKKQLVLAARWFHESAEAPTNLDFEWLFLNLVNHDEGGMEELLEKYGASYNAFEITE